MSKSVDTTVNHLHTAHAVSDSCGATSEKFRSSRTRSAEQIPVKPVPATAGLTPQQCLAIGHLLAGESYTKTAELVRIDPRTLYDWRRNPVFIARMNELCQETLEAVAMRTRKLLLRATERLECSVDGMMMFGDVLRVVSNKRIWEMAHVMPENKADETDDAKPDESAASDETPKDQTR